MKNNAKEYYFVMEETKQRELLMEVSELRLGDSRVSVVKRLGAPTYDRADVTKEGRALGRSVVYYLKIWEKGLVNEKHDKFVRLEFDTSDRLVKITQKIEDLH